MNINAMSSNRGHRDRAQEGPLIFPDDMSFSAVWSGWDCRGIHRQKGMTGGARWHKAAGAGGGEWGGAAATEPSHAIMSGACSAPAWRADSGFTRARSARGGDGASLEAGRARAMRACAGPARRPRGAGGAMGWQAPSARGG